MRTRVAVCTYVGKQKRDHLNTWDEEGHQRDGEGTREGDGVNLSSFPEAQN